MNMNIIIDPTQQNLVPLNGYEKFSATVNKSINGVVHCFVNLKHQKQCLQIIRAICDERGISYDRVPVFHRTKGRFRYWDIRQGEAGASDYAVTLCGSEWRIASHDEEKKHLAELDAARMKAIVESQAILTARTLVTKI